ncbi:MAG: hypothetical protein UY23_C0002G0024 [Candidatus Jorgensenbacteria bacterium GW2011_GWA1_48_11]|uniref:Prepilin type IV endopeptidase peptidase domain-containing protein n=1 Tax=Candidatus Jorgensenbacteria bacterium GW2011_GWA1_48_11 TaxID=1618660 RepID=A0A0G1XAB6_9BACT|nr:MAG: hypothetical protein UY23_C0002G0024 [Candidatus Jorgensenbacteria bacterium GW2011_GWA1_48_11]KKW12723.1 MAG: hypothetical protein UY51_C0001G0023 [Candidatus Jorgensenbacteria bacterium GW2011_GWB1_49_9]
MVIRPLADFIFGPFLTWSPLVFFWLVFVLALLAYFRPAKIAGRIPSVFLDLKNLILGLVIFRLLYAFLETAGQYRLWLGSGLTKLLLNSPLSREFSLPFLLDKFPGVFQSRLGYFLFYSYGRFWLGLVVAFGMALAFYFILKALKKYQERFFEENELALGFLLAFLVGWPGVLVFIVLLFIFILIISVFRRLFLSETYTTFSGPMFLAGFVTLGWESELVGLLNLTVFKI